METTSRIRVRGVLALFLAAVSGTLLAIAVAGLLAAPDCGNAGQGRCDDEVLLMVPTLIGGIALGVLSSVLGAGVGGFSACFIGVAIGSITGAGKAHMGAFPMVFGGLFATFGLLPPAIALALLPGRRRRHRALAAMQAHGRSGAGTVTSVQDTGATVNEDPLVRITVAVRPDDGSLRLVRTTTTLVPRVAIPRVGDPCIVRWLPEDEAGVLLDFQPSSVGQPAL